MRRCEGIVASCGMSKYYKTVPPVAKDCYILKNRFRVASVEEGNIDPYANGWPYGLPGVEYGHIFCYFIQHSYEHIPSNKFSGKA